MKLENQVCSLELAKRLKEFGVKQESLFYWHYYMGKESEASVCQSFGMSSGVFNSAFTVAELGEMLPDTIKPKGEGIAYFSVEKTDTKSDQIWEVYYEYFTNEGGRIGFNANTEANARAKMLVYLLENKLITL